MRLVGMQQRTVRRVRRTLDDAGAGLARARVLALCSGGVDSVALVALIARLPRGAAPAGVDVLFLDHGVRDVVSDERDAARAAAERFGFPFHEVRCEVRVADAPGGLQAGARSWRYETATRVARELGSDVVATGHTADDQLETLLLGLVGATTGGSVRGMRVCRTLEQGVRLVRPMLGVSRAEVEVLVHELALTTAEDPSNADPDAYLRNAIRHRVVPALLDVHPGAGAVLARGAARTQEREDAVADLADEVLRGWGGGGAMLDVRRLQQLEPAGRRAVIERWLRGRWAARTGGRELDSRTVRSVEGLATLPGRAACARIDLPDGACVRRDGYDLRVTPFRDTPETTSSDHA